MWLKRMCWLKHFKKSGERTPKNMRKILRFSTYGRELITPFVSECEKCGKRAFNIYWYHFMSDKLTNVLNAFLKHRVSKKRNGGSSENTN